MTTDELRALIERVPDEQWTVHPLIARIDCSRQSQKGGLLPVCQMLWPTEERSEDETRDMAALIVNFASPDKAKALLDRIATLERELATVTAERDRLLAERDTPETQDFLRGVQLEAAHQRARWAVDHDAGKSPFDWFWLIGYLAQKAADASVRGDAEKAKHHTISTSAALANWHLAICGDDRMRPGIGPKNGGERR